jgi:hypothetical protein
VASRFVDPLSPNLRTKGNFQARFSRRKPIRFPELYRLASYVDVNILTRIYEDSVSCPGLYGGLHGHNLPYKFKKSYGGRVTKCHAPMNSEFLFKNVVLIKVPWPHRQLYPGYFIHARILSGHTFSTLQSVPGSLIPEHILRDLSLFVCPHRLCFPFKLQFYL